MIKTIDCEYLGRPGFAAAYLIEADGRAAFVDNNTAHCVPLMLQALSQSGIGATQVDYLIVTHVHLDHAGGTSALLKHFPRATVLAHPRAARHLIDPSRLLASAKTVYGEKRFVELYGEISSLEPDRVRALEDGESVALGGRRLEFIHTRGHANHHFCILDREEKAIFTGDAFGLRYPALQSGGLFVFPSTSPTDFDPEEARKSVNKIVSSGAATAYPTHFGGIDRISEAAEQLLRQLDASEGVLNDAEACGQEGDDLVNFCRARLNEVFRSELRKSGAPDTPRTWEYVELDLDLNAQGVAFAARKRRESKAQTR